jgi:crotonobetainyl-CoA:carnitine CoA-transferase CaiB-like acyl-CoA transferase
MGSPPEELKRAGNEHRQFIPVNAYRTQDGFVYLAIGSDSQWRRLVRQPMFAELDGEPYATNEGRRRRREELHRTIEGITARHGSAEVSRALTTATVPHSPITLVEQVMELPFVASAALRTVAPDGREVRLPPPAVPTEHLDGLGGELPFAPAYGQHTSDVLEEAGVDPTEVETLRARGVVA